MTAPHSPTPPAPSASHLYESPRRQTLSPHTHTPATQQDARSEIRKDMELSLIECPVEAWFERYAPSQQAWNVGPTGENNFIERVEQHLRGKHSEGGKQPDPVLNGNGWKPFTHAMAHNQSENITYSTIAELAKAIDKAAQKVDTRLERTLVLDSSPQTLATTEVASYRFFPDARGILVQPSLPKVQPPLPTRRSQRRPTGPTADTSLPSDDATSSPSDDASDDATPLSRENADTAVIAEFKLQNGPADRKDNELKMIGAATTLMYNDPRRRYIMGFTIEKQQMRLWYFCRSHVCVSLPFDFVTQPRPFIRFLLTIIFSTPAELGFDPTVTRCAVKRGKKTFIAYQYRVKDDYYLTEGHPLSEDAAYRMVSRATRVWKVKKMIMAGGEWTERLEDKKYVLKDVWLYDDARLERDIQEAIFAALEAKDKNGTTTHATDAKQYFMTIIEDWKVTSDSREDRSAAAPDGWKPARFSNPGQALATPDPAALRTPSHDELSRLTISEPLAEPTLKHQPRIHVRTVFDEICQTLYEISDYKTVTKYIIDIVQVLRYMRLAGFVHRDVSPGNCLWHGPSGKAKISDLEYARPFSELSGHQPRTGTPSFMAVEYQLREHVFLPEITADPFQPEELPPKFFTFNYYHDIESVFWLYTWFLHYYPPGALTLNDETKQILTVSANKYLGCNVGGNSFRSLLIISVRRAKELEDALKPVYGAFSSLLFGISGTLGFLINAYRALEATAPVMVNNEPQHWHENNFQNEIYDQIQGFFTKLGKTPPFQLSDIPVQPLRPPPSDAVENSAAPNSEGKSKV
ncbi:hypothetical protein DFH06DRAFT_1229583 [Mycena polygramma]|nr:hypothetical protein DFH06DRAFT_1229583 [Mycena polygramma]